MKQKKKECKQCGKYRYIFSKGRCEFCAKIEYNNTAKENQLNKQNNSLGGKKKPTERYKKRKEAERDAMAEFWEKESDELGLCYCQECLLLGMSREKSCLGSEVNPYCVAHIISKGSNPKYQNDIRNFILLCPEHHQQFDAQFEGKTRYDMKIYSITEEIRTQLKSEDNV